MLTNVVLRVVAVIVLVSAAVGSFFLLMSTKTSQASPSTSSAPIAALASVSASAISSNGPYDLPPGTVIYHERVLSMPGYILSATERTTNGSSKEADLRTLGTPVVDGNSRGSGQPIDWGEEVDLGAIYNAGEDIATITFSSRLIVDLEPGEAIFTSSTLTLMQIEIDLIEHDLECKCKCQCWGCPGNLTVYISCSEAPTSGNCASLVDETCEIGECTHGTLLDCKRVYRKAVTIDP